MICKVYTCNHRGLTGRSVRIRKVMTRDLSCSAEYEAHCTTKNVHVPWI